MPVSISCIARRALVLAACLLSLPAQADRQFAERLTDAAISRTAHEVTYDGRYLSIDYPMGDVPENIGVCTDVLIRSYRQLDIDLQQLVHEDMSLAFDQYPNHWGLGRPDSNIDHRRVPNLRRFFERGGFQVSETPSAAARDYLPGDLVSWKLGNGLPHIGIVVDGLSADGKRHLIVHNIGRGPEIEDVLFRYRVTGHYRFHPELSVQ